MAGEAGTDVASIDSHDDIEDVGLRTRLIGELLSEDSGGMDSENASGRASTVEPEDVPAVSLEDDADDADGTGGDEALTEDEKAVLDAISEDISPAQAQPPQQEAPVQQQAPSPAVPTGASTPVLPSDFDVSDEEYDDAMLSRDGFAAVLRKHEAATRMKVMQEMSPLVLQMTAQAVEKLTPVMMALQAHPELDETPKIREAFAVTVAKLAAADPTVPFARHVDAAVATFEKAMRIKRSGGLDARGKAAVMPASTARGNSVGQKPKSASAPSMFDRIAAANKSRYVED